LEIPPSKKGSGVASGRGRDSRPLS